MCRHCIRAIKVALAQLPTVTWQSGDNPIGQVGYAEQGIQHVLDKLPKCRAMKALEGLTPSGSEFWEDPERCYLMVKDQRSSTHKLLISSITERNAALARIVLLEKEAGHGRGKEAVAHPGEPGDIQS